MVLRNVAVRSGVTQQRGGIGAGARLDPNQLSHQVPKVVHLQAGRRRRGIVPAVGEHDCPGRGGIISEVVDEPVDEDLGADCGAHGVGAHRAADDAAEEGLPIAVEAAAVASRTPFGDGRNAYSRSFRDPRHDHDCAGAMTASPQKAETRVQVSRCEAHGYTVFVLRRAVGPSRAVGAWSRPVPHVSAVCTTEHDILLPTCVVARPGRQIPGGILFLDLLGEAAKERLAALVAVEQLQHARAAGALDPGHRVEAAYLPCAGPVLVGDLGAVGVAAGPQPANKAEEMMGAEPRIRTRPLGLGDRPQKALHRCIVF